MQSAGNRLGSAMIQFTDVSVRFGGRQVLKNISMTVPFGETLAILGGSGAGKTTILRLIEGLWQPDTGSIRIDGQEIVGRSEERRVGKECTSRRQPGPEAKKQRRRSAATRSPPTRADAPLR